MLNKDNWPEVQYGKYVDHIEVNETTPEIRKNARYVSVEHLIAGTFKIQEWINEEMPTFFRTFKAGQILFGKRRAYQRKVAIAEFDGICSPHIWALESKEGLIQELLPYIMLTDKFYDYVNANSAGTMSVYLKWPQLSRYSFNLPFIEEQKQISSLFQSIDKVIEQIESQQENLLLLKKKLLQDLFSERRRFGKHLVATDYETIRFDSIAVNISERVEPKDTQLSVYVGLEHLDSDNLRIERTGKPDDVIGTKLKIYKGDIIFGKRRAYLRKVAVSHFDGIASAHSMVLRANQKNIEKEFLPFFMQSDEFMDRAVQISEGSLSPTIKTKTLGKQEFLMPKKSKQQELVMVFKQFDVTIEQLKQQRTFLKNLKQKLLNEILG